MKKFHRHFLERFKDSKGAFLWCKRLKTKKVKSEIFSSRRPFNLLSIHLLSLAIMALAVPR
jgi:hypothetical protein